MTSAYLQPSWGAILTGPTSHRRRVSRGWTAGGVILMVVGALLLSSPLLAMLAITYDPGTRVSASDGEDTAILARAARYDARLLRDGGSTAVGEAADPFSGTDAPAWRSDRDYLGQLGAGDAMARIRMPSIGVDLPIGHGTSAGTLEQGGISMAPRCPSEIRATASSPHTAGLTCGSCSTVSASRAGTT